MRVAKKGDTARVHYRGKLQDGSVFDETFDRGPLRFTIGGGELIPGFEEAVVGMTPGDSKTTEVPVEKAFGPHLEGRVVEVSKNKFAQLNPKPIVG
jgi:peptidylprolyl isomerase